MGYSVGLQKGENIMILPTTLCLAAAAAIVNIWLAIRCGKVRASEKVSVGDGGNENLVRRMRAQANFIEQVPLTLALVAAVELAGKGGLFSCSAALLMPMAWTAISMLAGASA
jgi:uncharacterized membrane protein YecN with MAPEG domain